MITLPVLLVGASKGAAINQLDLLYFLALCYKTLYPYNTELTRIQGYNKCCHRDTGRKPYFFFWRIGAVDMHPKLLCEGGGGTWH